MTAFGESITTEKNIHFRWNLKLLCLIFWLYHRIYAYNDKYIRLSNQAFMIRMHTEYKRKNRTHGRE